MMTRAGKWLAALVMAAGLSGPALAQENPGDILRGLLEELFRDDTATPPPLPAPETPPAPRNRQNRADRTEAPPVERRIPLGRGEIQLSFAPLVKQAAPAVVNVYAARKVQQRSPFAGDPFFDRFFGDGGFSGPPRVQQSLGSGVIVDPAGYVVTNNHVIEDAVEVKVALSDGEEFESEIVLRDKRLDLAVLRIRTADRLPVLDIANSDRVEIGDLVLAIGNPFGVGQTTTSGIVSAVARNQVGISDFGFFIQTDAAINPGNSGGALIDMAGRLIGINTAIFSRSGGSNGIGFAIPSNMVRVFLQQAKEGAESFERPWLGADFQNVTAEMAEALGLRRPTGAIVASVVEDGPADKAGLRPGDVVLSVDGVVVEHMDALGYRLATAGIGRRIDVEVIRRGERRLLRIELARAPETVAANEQVVPGRSPVSGAWVANLSPRLAERLNLPSDKTGVVITKIEDRSRAERYGFRPGDILLAVNGVVISEVDLLLDVANQRPSVWRFEIDRNGALIRQMLR